MLSDGVLARGYIWRAGVDVSSSSPPVVCEGAAFVFSSPTIRQAKSRRPLSFTQHHTTTQQSPTGTLHRTRGTVHTRVCPKRWAFVVDAQKREREHQSRQTVVLPRLPPWTRCSASSVPLPLPLPLQLLPLLPPPPPPPLLRLLKKTVGLLRSAPPFGGEWRLTTLARLSTRHSMAVATRE
jgi:hypothetical protein